MNVFERSWSTTKTSFAVIGQDKELLLFPVVAAILSTIFSIAMLFPTIIAHLLEGAAGFEFGPLQIAATFATYLGLAFITTFSNVCVVYTTKVRLTGGDATFFESIGFALKRSHRILAWSVLSATVGLLLRWISDAAENSGAVGQIVLSILESIIAAAWSILTVFAIPAMVFYDLGPIDAIKKSGETLKRMWGESLVGHWGLGFMSFLMVLPGIGSLIGGFVMIGAEAQSFGIGLVLVGIVLLILASLVIGVLKMVYTTALFMYAESGTAPQGFSQELLAGAYSRR
jgi:Family of unknown function (DUF6159)